MQNREQKQPPKEKLLNKYRHLDKNKYVMFTQTSQNGRLQVWTVHNDGSGEALHEMATVSKLNLAQIAPLPPPAIQNMDQTQVIPAPIVQRKSSCC